MVQFPESAPIPASSPITIFNGPKRHGNPTVLAHAHLTVPAPTTFIVPIEIQKVHDGRYGYRTVAEIPKIANGAGIPIYGRISIGRKWTYKGKRMSYINASCPDGHLQAKGQFSFSDGTVPAGDLRQGLQGQVSFRRALAAIAAVGLIACASAYAITAEFGSTVVSATAVLTPRALPARGGAPVTLRSSVRIGTNDGTQPPALKTLTFLFDKHGFLETQGVPVCTMAKLAETTPAQARQRCAGALVGKGIGKARVAMPGQAPVTITSPLSFFNAAAGRRQPEPDRPRLRDRAVTEDPAGSDRDQADQRRPRYGFKVEIEMPAIAEGFGAATLAEAAVGRTFGHGGRKVGYVNAACSGGRLQVHGSMTFSDGDFFPATLVSACHVPN